MTQMSFWWLFLPSFALNMLKVSVLAVTELQCCLSELF